jgi:outer membrane protein assembly factor BamB
MKILITPDLVSYAEKGPTLFEFDTETKTTSEILAYKPELDCTWLDNCGRRTFRPFGIAQDENFIYVASNEHIGRFDKNTLEFAGLLEGATAFMNTHQLYISDNKMYIANSGNDSLGIYDFSLKSTQYYDFNTFSLQDSVQRPKDVVEIDKLHINSVWVNNKIVYVVAHRLGAGMSSIFLFDQDTFELLWRVEAGYCSHNVLVHDGVLYTLSTDSGDLVAINLETSKKLTYTLVDTTHKFLRGLCLVGDSLYIGASMNFHVPHAIRSGEIIEFDTVQRKAVSETNLGVMLVLNDMVVKVNG